MSEFIWSVFTKPWASLPGDELGKLVAGLGFTGAEVPVRDNAFVTPANALSLLPGFVAQLREHGVTTISIASDLAEETFAACQAAGVPLIRIMAELGADGYTSSVRRMRARLESVVALAREYDVQVGVQPHHGRFVSSSLGVLALLEGLPTDHFKVVWDAAHDALAGDDPTVTLPLVADRLAIVNLKNVVYRPTTGGAWTPYYVEAPDGLANWSTALTTLTALNYTGPICLTAQYSDPTLPLEPRLQRDLTHAQTLA
ncbi:sugar phosphate isomerase/epimerase [Kribbella sp. NBC_01245]|uniref:sugar phosphate isomerase/epimerase family protein n=1 Tax=Kribbella sp. NBC_01245 TaxID=2903578 RepID=UPI002E2AE349|nr:sugar phosphate isomerase/epimerase [Kribbella sp. NBC_01245]